MKFIFILMLFITLSCKENKTNNLKNIDNPNTAVTTIKRDSITISNTSYYLNFDKNSNKEKDIVLFGKYGLDRFNQNNASLQLDGISDLLEIDNLSELNPKEQITISIWYKPDSYKGTGQNAIIWKASENSDAPYCQYFFSATGNLYPKKPGAFKFGLSIDGNFSHLSTKEGVWEPAKWYNLTGTFDGNKMKFYVNGELSSQRNITGHLDNYNTTVLIGKTPYKEYYTSGQYDDFRLFNRALSKEEINKISTEK